jgi:RNA polymerase sigma-70 factor (ECF subfamily)
MSTGVETKGPAGHSASKRSAWFTTTHWSVVLAAGRGDSARAQAALEQLCQTYWYPLYVFVRRLGHGPHDAEDLVQGFFAQCLEKNYLAAAEEAKGRFRSFLLIVLKRFLSREWEKVRAKKRGGRQTPIPLDALSAEQRYALEPADQLSADKLYERRWALTLLETVLERLRAEQAESGRRETFEQLKDTLTSGGRGTPYAELAARLGLSEAAVKVAVYRLRQRYRELLEAEIAHTVSSPKEVAEERRYLLRVLSG